MPTGLIVKKETKFDKIRKLLNRIFFKEEYYLEAELQKKKKKRSINTSKIVIPREIGKNKIKM